MNMKNENTKKVGDSGFSLVEVTIAMVILLVGLLGVSVTYTSAVSYNAGNNARLQSLAILQQEVEQIRNARFTPTNTDTALLGGIKPTRPETRDGNTYQVQIIVDDDPFTGNVQINPNKTLKEITVLVFSENQAQSWVSAVPATVTLRRVRSN